MIRGLQAVDRNAPEYSVFKFVTTYAHFILDTYDISVHKSSLSNLFQRSPVKIRQELIDFVNKNTPEIVRHLEAKDYQYFISLNNKIQRTHDRLKSYIDKYKGSIKREVGNIVKFFRSEEYLNEQKYFDDISQSFISDRTQSFSSSPTYDEMCKEFYVTAINILKTINNFEKLVARQETEFTRQHIINTLTAVNTFDRSIKTFVTKMAYTAKNINRCYKIRKGDGFNLIERPEEKPVQGMSPASSRSLKALGSKEVRVNNFFLQFLKFIITTYDSIVFDIDFANMIAEVITHLESQNIFEVTDLHLLQSINQVKIQIDQRWTDKSLGIADVATDVVKSFPEKHALCDKIVQNANFVLEGIAKLDKLYSTLQNNFQYAPQPKEIFTFTKVFIKAVAELSLAFNYDDPKMMKCREIRERQRRGEPDNYDEDVKDLERRRPKVRL